MIRDRIQAFLAQDGEAEPQSRDRQQASPFGTSISSDRVQPPDDISTWVDAYEKSPLINVPVRKFASDVTAPGYRIEVDDDSDLADELMDWATSVAIVNGDLDGRDFADILYRAVIDAYGRRGTTMAEWVYDDAEAQETLMGLRPFRAETVTAYVRPGQNILLQPDANEADFEATTPDSRDSNGDRDDVPRTKAGKTAAFVQFDDVFGSREHDEVPLAADDVTRIVHDPDTGDIFGRPATAHVASRALAIESKFQDADQGIKAKAYKLWLVRLEGMSKGEADSYVSDLALDDPTEKSVTNQPIDVETIDGEVPDIVEHLQIEVEYVLSATPVPVYQTGFAGDINRDITGEQADSYEKDVRDERRRLESRFESVFQAKADELRDGDAPDVTLVIEPEKDDSPLADETFEADEFAKVMQGLKAAAPGGAVEQIIPPETVLETFLGLDPDEVLDTERGEPPLDETDPEVAAAFENAFDADLASQYEEGDEVSTPQGPGVVVEVRTAPFTGPSGSEIDASESSPTYIVAVEDGAATFKASDLSSDPIEVDVEAPAQDLSEAAAAQRAVPGQAEAQETTFGIPDSWEESETPNRIILLKAWAGLGGRFTSCVREMRGELAGSPDRFCASMKDRVLQWEGWRKGGG